MLQFIQENPALAIGVAVAVGWFLWTRKPAEPSPAVSYARQLPEIVPVAKSRSTAEAIAALDVIVATLRDRGCPEPELQIIVSGITPRLYGSPPQA